MRMQRLAGVIAVVAVAVGLSAGASSAGPSLNLDTISIWNGSDFVWEFGAVGSDATPTYGQVIAGPGADLASFTFEFDLPATVNFRPVVAEWDGTKALTPLWSGSATSTAGSGWEAITFTLPAGVLLESGKQYVLFVTTLGEGGSDLGEMGAVDVSELPAPAQYVYTNDEASFLDEWDGGIGDGYAGDYQLAFTAVFGAAQAAQPGRAGYCSVAGNTTATGAAIAPGTFLDLETGQPATDSHYKGATPAYYYQGLGISCDNLSGYTKTGEMVGYGGHGDPGGYTYMAKN